ncbi:MAG: hypothetical protein IIC58_09485 [Proteobacteria bacterium]|nr:hypothetical protein [Pseudomonadota bacterium]
MLLLKPSDMVVEAESDGNITTVDSRDDVAGTPVAGTPVAGTPVAEPTGRY